MYSGIQNDNSETLSFDIVVEGKCKSFDPVKIGSIIKVPATNQLLPPWSEDVGVRTTNFLCGTNTPWKQGNSLPIAQLFPQFCLLHNIFIGNVYPRSKNRSELTTDMVHIQYLVRTETSICLLSLICHRINQFY